MYFQICTFWENYLSTVFLLHLFSKRLGYSHSQGCSIEQLRIWPFSQKQNQTYRPGSFDLESEMSKQMTEVADLPSWNIFLEIISLDLGSNALPNFDSESEVLVFFKLYDPKVRKIHYCGHSYVFTGSTLGESRILVIADIRSISFQSSNCFFLFAQKI